jgi:hypothetical protein
MDLFDEMFPERNRWDAELDDDEPDYDYDDD